MKNKYFYENNNLFDDLFSNPYTHIERFCEVSGCIDRVFYKGCCKKHYYKSNRLKNRDRKCQKCPKNVWKGLFCYMHYEESNKEKKCRFDDKCQEKQSKDGLCSIHLNESLPKCIEEYCTNPICTRKSRLCMRHYQKNRREKSKKKSMNIELLIDSNVKTLIDNFNQTD